MKLIISASIIKKVSSLYGFMYMFTLSVPPISPNVSVLPVINGQQQASLNIDINVSILTRVCIIFGTKLHHIQDCMKSR